jgi:diacylglycerol kinase (ATP)
MTTEKGQVASEGTGVTPLHGGERGWRRLCRATADSLRGLGEAFRHEEAFRQECVWAVILLPASFFIGQSGVQVALLAGSVLLVLIVELLNSAVETTVDRIGLEHHELSGQAKRLGSAAVFISLINVIVVWAAIIIQNL